MQRAEERYAGGAARLLRDTVLALASDEASDLTSDARELLRSLAAGAYAGQRSPRQEDVHAWIERQSERVSRDALTSPAEAQQFEGELQALLALEQLRRPDREVDVDQVLTEAWAVVLGLGDAQTGFMRKSSRHPVVTPLGACV